MEKKFFKEKSVLILIIIIVLLSTTNSYGGLISTEQEIELGTEAAQQLEGEYGLYYDQQLNSWVSKVGKTLVYIEARDGMTYSFKVLDMEEPNALAIPGGFIYVTKGLLRDFIKNDEDMLAVVLGHELGHVNERHGMKQLEWSLGLGVLLEVLLGNNSTASDIAQMASGLIFLNYSRSQETDADNYGMTIAHRAGYDPRALIKFFRQLQVYEESNSTYSPEFLQSHPDTESRIEDAERYMAEELGIASNNPSPEELPYYQPTPYTDHSGYNNSGVNLTGTWDADVAAPLVLKQKGNKVVGTYQNGQGTMEGVIKGNKFNYEWRDSNSQDYGTGYFDISSDGNELEGEWYSPAGDSGEWKAWRNENYSNTYNPPEPSSDIYDISGSWDSSLGEITFVQKGTAIEGYFGGGKGRIKGTLSESRLDYEWYEYVDNEGGTGYFIISDDGDSMYGQWFSENGASGKWSATR